MTSVLILGGYGFVGSHLADILVEEGLRVRLFDLPGADPWRIGHLAGKVETMEGDFTAPDRVRDALEGMDVVVHLACSTIPATSNAEPASDLQTNLVGTVNMLGAAVEAGVEKVIFASSGGAVYGPAQRLPIAENHPTEPVCSYGIHKLAVEKYLALFGKLYGLDWVALRPSNPYGPRQNAYGAQGAVSVFARAIKDGDTIAIWGDGETVRDYIHVFDLARAYAEVVTGSPPSSIYNIGTGEGTSLARLVELLEEVSGRKARVEYQPGRPVDVKENVLDCSRARNELDWEPAVSLRDGLKEYFEED